MKRLCQIIQSIMTEISSVNVSVYAANAAFFLFLSLFPALLFLLSITQYTVISMDGILSFLSPIVPDALLPLLEFVLDDLSAANPVSILSLSTILLLWSASKGVYGLVKGLNQAFHLKETRPYLQVRFRCVLYTVAVLAVIIITVMLYTVSQSFLARIFVTGSFIHQILSTILHYRWFVASVILFVMFTVVYIAFPCKKNKLRHVLPGSLASTAGWIIFSTLYSLYVSLAGGTSSIYGGISIIAFAMLWLYICMNILFYGAIFSHYLAKHRQEMKKWFQT